MKNYFFISLSGLLFGFGLSLSAMLDRHRIINFLDITGNWDPTLLFVMFSAVLVTVVFFRFILRRHAPILDNRFRVPTRKDIDASLLVGSAIFGAGWGLAGYCPGPGFAAMTLGSINAILFTLAYITGSLLSSYYSRKLQGENKP
ncbi:MAG: YeeE/YedE family protein [Gammaproteobacteria bacterium RIFCSPLOWO2_02_FULL_47_50]|nr:MAG: YeeE/YedE family protein [Gammaproteobacteria bacterium RIFCSPLOWO2_01_FULL_47_190]OGT74835.1 MAG: YeeE/YedE family protein [Gammaproteobacteria bacterium RIFCSPLOWO2_12_47_11]OGT81050.1 MAG: YeeE/YedE family protein [Gammaproteobacteria bacterium RIFCSPLOWO2_02_FULL_47_50]OGT84923.1 MAG: YeeE/YedE family protein [Gammaproteobacteria bacterium RIFCSPLOWO2_12_FULL_47_76]